MAVKKRIAFLCHPYHRGGVTKWMADAALYAAKTGIEVYFVTVQPATEFHSSGGRETMVGLLNQHKTTVKIVSKMVGFTFEFGTDDYRAVIYGDLIRAHVPLGTPIIVSDDLAVWSAAAAVANAYPMIGVLHGDQDYYYDKAKAFYKQLSICVCVSQRVAKTAIEKVPPLDNSRVYSIPCGINVPAFALRDPQNDVTRLIFVGRLTDYEKRAYDLVGICARLNQLSFPFHLDIVGNSEASKETFTEDFRKNGINDFVTFHGWQPAGSVQLLLENVDILLLTSNSEGMPLVMMEALASGCGFVGTRVSGIEDYEYDKRAANCVSVYAVGDIVDAVNKITLLAAIPAAIRQTDARNLAVGEFSLDICLQKYFDAVSNTSNKQVSAKAITMSPAMRIYSHLLSLARFMKVSAKRKHA